MQEYDDSAQDDMVMAEVECPDCEPHLNREAKRACRCKTCRRTGIVVKSVPR